MVATRRRTRDSVVPGELLPPYNIRRDFHKYDDGLVHACGWPYGATEYLTCCHVRFGPTLVVYDGATCIKCMLCRGCPACQENHICEATMRLGKWETKDGRKLYVFEMDDQHLRNSLAKILRDQEKFKKNWADWVGVLGEELRLRGIK